MTNEIVVPGILGTDEESCVDWKSTAKERLKEIERLRKQLKDCEQLLAAHDPKRECGYWMRTSPPEPAERCLVAGCGKPCLVAEDGAVGGLCEEHNGNVIRPRDEGEPLPSPETESDRVCVEADGCPTEMAVLKRFWRASHALLPPEGPMPSGCAHPQWEYFETNETLRGGCGFLRCKSCGTERVTESRRQKSGGSR